MVFIKILQFFKDQMYCTFEKHHLFERYQFILATFSNIEDIALFQKRHFFKSNYEKLVLIQCFDEKTLSHVRGCLGFSRL
jgi:hypothetical protein